jgi:divalent metal cation (Fe/Co/Zn/Cd) transporter
MEKSSQRLYKVALRLSLFTIIYNIFEGIISVFLGAHDETLTLFGFGLDSIIEVISGIGIYFMVRRIQQSKGTNKSAGEIRALKITGISFYVLIGLLLISAVIAIITQHHPLATFSGAIISAISIIVMLILARLKITTGRKLDSKAIIADGNCTMVCVYMSVILFVSSLFYTLTHLAYADVLGTLGLCWFCYTEGKEAIEGAKHIEQSGCC